jgi:hypothetical protein
VNVLDFYLDEEREAERIQIIKLAHREDPKSTETLRGYVREAMREYCLVCARNII